MIISCWLETTKHISTSARSDRMSCVQGNSISHLFFPNSHSTPRSTLRQPLTIVIISSTNKSRKTFFSMEEEKKQIFNERAKKTFNEVRRSTRHACRGLVDGFLGVSPVLRWTMMMCSTWWRDRREPSLSFQNDAIFVRNKYTPSSC